MPTSLPVVFIRIRLALAATLAFVSIASMRAGDIIREKREAARKINAARVFGPGDFGAGRPKRGERAEKSKTGKAEKPHLQRGELPGEVHFCGPGVPCRAVRVFLII